MKDMKVSKLCTALLLVGILLIQGCGMQKETVTEYDSSSGKSVGEIIQEKLDESDTNVQKDDSAGTEQNGENAKDEDIDKKAEEILAKMTLEEKVYQMFVVTPETLTGYDEVTESTDITKGKLEEYPVGGLIYFTKNLRDEQQTKRMLNNTTASAIELQGLPIFLCVDEEGGRVVRVAENDAFDVTNVGAMQDISSKEDAYAAGETIGTYLSNLGFNVDFAPVADVITNEKNEVIGDRSFGTDASVVTEYAVAYSDGLRSQEILSTFKHFPGHGATEGDTHEGFAYTTKTYEELIQSELVPFTKAEEAGVDMIMVAHISVPNVTGDNTPCTLSYKMITEILRGDLGYNGLVITDGMNMGAITDNYSSKEATVKAIQAGVDLVLMPENFHSAVEGVLEAVEQGEITEDRINESVIRIIKKKLMMQS